jgi:hypothetical protein
MAELHPGIREALLEDLAHDDMKWRPVDAEAESRIRAYVAADVAAGESTLSSLADLDDLIER